MRNQKGITLVALVITIIVMLILVAVSVTVAINGGLFTQAKEAGNAWETKSAEEANGNIVQVKNDDGTITTTTIGGAITSLSGTTTQTITFTVEDQAENWGEETVYTTTATTWAEWIENGAPEGFTVDEWDNVKFNGCLIIEAGGVIVKGQDTLKDGYTYTISQM